MKIITFAFAFILQCLSLVSYAQTDNYNVRRAIESLNENDKESAIYYLNQEIEKNPHSIAGLDLLGYIYFCDGEFGTAISLFDKAINNAKKKDKDILAIVFYHRAGVRAELGDTINSIADYKESLRLDPKYRQAIVELGDMYFYTKQYKESDAIYRRLIELDSSDPYPYYGIARNAYKNSDFETAREEIKKGEMLDTDKERPALMKMRVESLSYNPKSSLEYAIAVLNANCENSEAYYNVMELSDSLYQTALNRVIKQKFEHPENDFWSILLSHLYIRHDEPQKAIENLIPLIESNSELKLPALYWAATCYDVLEKDETVIKLMNQAIRMDSTDANFYYMRANALFYIQEFSKAKTDYERMMELDKDYGYYGYYKLGWIKEIQKDYQGALNDYNMSIALNDTYSYSYMMKGNLLKDYLGKEEEAEDAFRKCIETDAGINEGTCKQYAYWGVGQTEKAIAVCDSILEKYDDPGSYYDAACLYSRMNREEEAIRHLAIAFEKGFNRIKHMENDNDLDNIRNTSGYKNLLDKYKSQILIINDSLETINTVTYEVPLCPIGNGTYQIRCSVNDLDMNFILDTGSTNVSLSSTESDFMIKNGYLSVTKLGDYTKYQNATGEMKFARKVTIDEIRIGAISIKNVEAVIVPNQKAPLLLGQNVLNRLGTIEIDQKEELLKIHTYEEE